MTPFLPSLHLLTFPFSQYYDVSQQDKQRIFAAATAGDLETMRVLLEGREQLVNYIDEETGNTPLHAACLQHHGPLLQWLVQQKNVMPNLTNKAGKTPCYILCEQGDARLLNTLLVSLPTLLDTSIGCQHFSPLMIACKLGHIDVVRSLLASQSSSPVRHRAYYASPLSCACDSGSLALLDFLLSQPSQDVNERLHLGGTVLHHACINNQKEAFRRLLQVPDLDVNIQTDFGLTALLTCCQNKKYNIALELLRDPRIDLNISDSRNRTALWMAASGESPSLFLGILVLSRQEVDTDKTPDGSPYSLKFKKFILEYKKDRASFVRKYGKEFLPTEQLLEGHVPSTLESHTPVSSPPLTPSSHEGSSSDELDVEEGSIDNQDAEGQHQRAALFTGEGGPFALVPPSSSSPNAVTAKEPMFLVDASPAPLPSAMLSLLFVVENLRNDPATFALSSTPAQAAGDQMLPKDGQL